VSEDSQTILLNPSSSSSKRKETEEKEENQTPAQTTSQEVEEPRRCWICFTDETEDTPTSSEWRSPCPCALEAHESCLLDWIADMEAPGSRRQRSPNDKILCPQCKSEIQLARPKSYVVDAVRAVEIMGHKLVLPGVLTVGVSSFWYLCWVHGASSVMLVFGQRDGERILAPLLRPLPGPNASIQTLLDHWRQRVRVDLGLFCIPSMLIFSRTTLADGILPILPILFFVTKPDADPFSEIGNWPPSAGLSFALLPYLRSIYNNCYDRVWGEHEKRWLKEIQPRATTEAQEGDNDANNNAEADIDAGENVLEINVDLAMLEDWDEDDEAPPPPPLEQAHPLNDPPLDAPGARAEEQPGVLAVAPAPDIPRHRNQNIDNNNAAPVADANHPQPPAAERNNNFNLAVSTNRLFESVLGALAFPAVSAVMGEFLRLVLPRSWTTLPGWSWRAGGSAGKPTGMLQQKWGRSLVGGCMFVVLKDAVMLYVRWRMARDHRMRRVLDYKGKKGRRGGSGSVAVK
jgi:hypothetical protein